MMLQQMFDCFLVGYPSQNNINFFSDIAFLTNSN